MYLTLEKFKHIGYTKNDNGGNIDDRKSTFGYTFHFGTGVVSWDSKEHPIVTISSIEAEYVVTTLNFSKVEYKIPRSFIPLT